MSPNSTPLLTIPQVAEILGISRSHAYDTIVAQGLLPLIRIGRTVRVRPEDVDALIARLARGEVVPGE